MKTIIFLRGIDSPLKRQLSQQIMQVLNPDVNGVRAIKISLSQFIERPDDKGAVKAADRSVKNLLKKILFNHSETHILIDNESSLPLHWQSFISLVKEWKQEVSFWGIDVPTEAQRAATDVKRSNFHATNSAQFKLDMDKYISVNIDQQDDMLREFAKAL